MTPNTNTSNYFSADTSRNFPVTLSSLPSHKKTKRPGLISSTFMLAKRILRLDFGSLTIPSIISISGTRIPAPATKFPGILPFLKQILYDILVFLRIINQPEDPGAQMPATLPNTTNAADSTSSDRSSTSSNDQVRRRLSFGGVTSTSEFLVAGDFSSLFPPISPIPFPAKPGQSPQEAASKEHEGAPSHANSTTKERDSDSGIDDSIHQKQPQPLQTTYPTLDGDTLDFVDDAESVSSSDDDSGAITTPQPQKWGFSMTPPTDFRASYRLRRDLTPSNYQPSPNAFSESSYGSDSEYDGHTPTCVRIYQTSISQENFVPEEWTKVLDSYKKWTPIDKVDDLTTNTAIHTFVVFYNRVADLDSRLSVFVLEDISELYQYFATNQATIDGALVQIATESLNAYSSLHSLLGAKQQANNGRTQSQLNLLRLNPQKHYDALLKLTNSLKTAVDQKLNLIGSLDTVAQQNLHNCRRLSNLGECHNEAKEKFATLSKLQKVIKELPILIPTRDEVARNKTFVLENRK